MRHAGPAFSLYNDAMEARADADELTSNARRHCRRVLDELGRYRQDLAAATTSRTLAPEAVAEGQAAVEAAAVAIQKVFDELGNGNNE